MRLTASLCRGKRIARNYLDRVRKHLWHNYYSKMKVDRLRVPERVITDPKNPLGNAEDMLTSTRYEDALAEEIELGITLDQAAQIEAERERRMDPWRWSASDPRQHPLSQPSLIYSNKRRFTKGLEQASLLTNAIILPGAPSGISELSQQLDHLITNSTLESSSMTDWKSDLRTSVERAILHAHLWQSNETKLPRRFRPELTIWKHKAEFGIHPQQCTRYLFQNLFRLLSQQESRLQDLLHLPISPSGNDLPERWTTRDRLLETHYYWGDPKRRIAFSEHHDLVTYGRKPLPPFASDFQVQEISTSNQMPIKVLGPMSPLIDLQSTCYYRDNSTSGWIGETQRVFPHPHLITVNLSLPNMWSDFLEPEADPVVPEQRQAGALMHCFATALARAHEINAQPGPLTTPICVNAVCSDGVFFDFVYFQLNTLDFPDPMQEMKDTNFHIRNIAWVDGHHRLFDKQIPKRSLLRNTKYRDLDMSVFWRLTTTYLWSLVGQHYASRLPDFDKAERVASTVA